MKSTQSARFVANLVSSINRIVVGLCTWGVLGSAPAVAQGSLGSWEGPWTSWDCCMNPSGCPVTSFPEISHAALIPKGPFTGKVILWHRATTPSCASADVVVSWIWDPLSPDRISALPTNPPASPPMDDPAHGGAVHGDIFCAGMSWDGVSGTLLVAGANRPISVALRKELIRFHPSLLSGPSGDFCCGGAPCTSTSFHCGPQLTGNVYAQAWQWMQYAAPGGALATTQMSVDRFYPTIIALSKRTITYTNPVGNPMTLVGGAHLVLGGATLSGGGWNSVWDLLPYGSNLLNDPIDDFLSTSPPNAAERYVVFDAQTNQPVAVTSSMESYPRAIQMSTGDILVTHDVQANINPPTGSDRGRWSVIRPYGPYPPNTSRFEMWLAGHHTVPTAGGTTLIDRNYGPAVLLHRLGAPDQVLVFGGADLQVPAAAVDASDTVEEFKPNPNGPSPLIYRGSIVNGAWSPKARMQTKRTDFSATVLPDATILLTGGFSSCAGYPCPSGNPVVVPELYDPDLPGTIGGGMFVTPPNDGPNGPTARLYHNAALLLMDGSVLLLGGEPATSGQFSNGSYTAEVYKPAYMDPDVRRVTFQLAQSAVLQNSVGSNAQTFTIQLENLNPGSRQVKRVVLTRPGAVTHFFDNDQRYVELNFAPIVQTSDSESLTVTSLHENLGPPGYYLLWVVTQDGSGAPLIPSVASIIHFQ